MKKWDSITVEPGTSNHYLVKNNNDFLTHTIIPNIKHIIEGKRIALVCPGTSLLNLGEGSLIDSYDIVVRINQKFKLSHDKEKDYGSKGDILIGSFNNINIKECENNYNYIKSFKHIVGVMPSYNYQPKINFFNKMKKDGLNCTRLNDRYIYKVFKEVGTVVNSGLMGIIFLMNYNIKELYVTGLTFYNMGNFGDIYHNEYKNSVEKFGQVSDKNSHDHKIHKQLPQIEYFKSLYKQKKEIIKLDKYLTKNLFI
jgi:hypothetical protein